MVTQTRPRLNRKLAVRIAQDVIAQIRLERYIASPGTYVSVKVGGQTVELGCYDTNTCGLDRTASFQQVFQDNKEVKCNVCALGSLFTSFVNVKNEVSVEQIADPQFDLLFEKLNGAFSAREMLLMEYVFEQGGAGYVSDDVPHSSDVLDATDESYGDEFPNEFDVYDQFGDTQTFTRDELRRAIRYGERYEDDNERLRVIMLNVVRNNGRFVLPKRVR